MRHLVLLSAFLISGSAAAADPPPRAAPPAGILSPDAKNSATGQPCQRSNVVPARPGESPRPNRLGELPPGDVVLAVLRQEDGCYKPVIVRYGVGTNAAPAPQERRQPRPLRPQRL